MGFGREEGGAVGARTPRHSRVDGRSSLQGTEPTLLRKAALPHPTAEDSGSSSPEEHWYWLVALGGVCSPLSVPVAPNPCFV